jgi:hypothetical protein
MQNTRKHWAGLHQEALSEIEKEIVQKMAQDNLQHPLTDAQIAEQKQAAHAALEARIAELEQRLAELTPAEPVTEESSPLADTEVESE